MGKLIGLAALGVVVLLGIVLVGGVLGFRTDCIKAEAGIKAQYKQNQNNYDNMWKKFKEMAQVPDMYVDHMKKLWDGAIKGRYGENGSQALFQFIQEQNPQVDPSLYTKVQTAIEAGRNGFEADQKQLLAQKQSYEVLLGSTGALFFNPILNFPRINLAEYDIVTSEETEDAFKKKKAKEIDLRSNGAEAQ